jgi:hypothetical protein
MAPYMEANVPLERGARCANPCGLGERAAATAAAPTADPDKGTEAPSEAAAAADAAGSGAKGARKKDKAGEAKAPEEPLQVRWR